MAHKHLGEFEGPAQRKEQQHSCWEERQDCCFWQHWAVSLTQPCCESSPLGNNVHTAGWLTVLQIVARRELGLYPVCFCRVALSVFGVLCFETDTYSILIVLLHEKVLQKSYMCRADLSGNLMLSKWIRRHRTWKTLYLSFWDNLPIAFGGTQKTLVLPSAARLKAGAKVWTFIFEHCEVLIRRSGSPVNVVYTSPWILSAPKPGVPLKPWLQISRKKSTMAHPFSSPGSLQKWVGACHFRKKETLFFENCPSAFGLLKLAWSSVGFGFAFFTNWNV